MRNRVKTVQEIKVWRLPELPAVELHRGKAVTRDCPRHWHEELHLCVIESGSGELRYRGTTYSTPARSLFIVAPGETHENYSETGCYYRNLYFDPSVLRGTAEDFNGYGKLESLFTQPVLYDARLINFYLEAHRALEGPVSLLELESLLLGLMVHLTNRREKQPSPAARKESDVVNRLRDFLVESYQENVSLNRLSEIARMSPFHLNRIFCLQVGMPPHAFQTQVRVLKAKKLLREGYPVSTVASATGFADQSHLTRHFKQLVGITPGTYARCQIQSVERLFSSGHD
jgi:AraC-like DNA-binding protein